MSYQLLENPEVEDSFNFSDRDYSSRFSGQTWEYSSLQNVDTTISTPQASSFGRLSVVHPSMAIFLGTLTMTLTEPTTYQFKPDENLIYQVESGVSSDSYRISNYKKLIQLLAIFYYQSNVEHQTDFERITDDTVVNSKCFLDILVKESIPLPKIAPDGDGGIIFAWENSKKSMLVALQDNLISFVNNAGTPKAVYKDDLLFDSNTIPKDLMEALTDV